MKITRVETLVLNLPMVIDGATPMLGGRARTSIDMLLVRIDTDAGVTGWGEAFGHRIFPATRAAIDTLLGPMCVGRDPSQIAALHDDLQRVLHGVGRNGPTIYALSGIDIALWDIAGKVAGLPLYRLLGGGAARRPAGLREPAALRHGRRRGALHRAGAGARLSPHQAARDHRARGEGGARRGGRRHADHGGHQLPVDGARGDRDGAPAGAARPALARGAGVAAGEPRRPRRGPRSRGGIATAAGENYGTVWEFRRAFEAGAHRPTRSRA